MFGSWVLEVFRFDLPFDIHLQIASNWNLAENRVTEIDVYVQHLQLDVLVNKLSGGRKEGRNTVFPEKQRRNMQALKASRHLGYPTRLNLHLLPPQKTCILQTYSEGFWHSSNNAKDYFISLEVQLSSSGPECPLKSLTRGVFNALSAASWRSVRDARYLHSLSVSFYNRYNNNYSDTSTWTR